MSAGSVFDALAARVPASAVLVGAGSIWSAADLLAATGKLASQLGQCRTLAVLADNGPEWVVADLATLRAGITHVPLPAFFSPSQLAHALDQSGADAVLTDQPARIGELDLGFSITGHWNRLTWMRRVASPASLPAGTAKISFTSGSTGNPKGVCLSAAGLMDTARSVSDRLADLPISRHLASLPLPLLLENTAGVYAPLLRGAEIHLPGLQALGWQGMAGFNPAALQATVDAIRPNSLILVPELLKAWALYLDATRRQAAPSLSYIAVGGARVDADLIRKSRALGLPAYQGYGLTECGSVISLNRPGDDGDGVGRPLGHANVVIEDGEVVASTRSFLGYLGKEASARETAAAGQFATGDLGHADGKGHLHLSGRRKNLLITSYGRNIAPEWVEASLLAQPAILQAIVTGDARPWLSAVLVPAPNVDPGSLAAAVACANASLPDYARIRDWITAAPFTLQNGQATGNGRPVRAAILDHHAAPLAALYQQKDPANALL